MGVKRIFSPDISVILPVYRTVRFLKPLYQRLVHVMKSHGFSYELIFVNDASPDHAQEILQGLAHHDPGVRVLCHPINQGQHKAVMTGFSHAKGKIIAVMDTDLQDEPEVLPFLIQHLDETHPIVFGGRRGEYESRFRLLCSKLHKSLISLVTGLPRDASMFFVCRKEVVDRMLLFRVSTPFVLVLLARTGFPMHSLPIRIGGDFGWHSTHGNVHFSSAFLLIRSMFHPASPKKEKKIHWHRMTSITSNRFSILITKSKPR